MNETKIFTADIFDEHGNKAYIPISMPSGGDSGGGTGGGGADWNANEGEVGYIENRPFYEIKQETKIIDATIEPKVQSQFPDAPPMCTFEIPEEIFKTFKTGTILTIDFNNKGKKNIEIFTLEMHGYPTILGGNAVGIKGAPFAPENYPDNLQGSDWEYILMIAKNPTNKYIGRILSNTAQPINETYTLVLNNQTLIIKKIDPKFLSEVNWNANESEPGFIKNRPFYEEVSGSETVVINKQVFDVQTLPNGKNGGIIEKFLPEANWEDGDKGIIEIIEVNSGKVVLNKEVLLGKIEGNGNLYFVGNLGLMSPDYISLTKANDETADWIFTTTNLGGQGSEMTALLWTEIGQYSVSIKSSDLQSITHKIDVKFLPIDYYEGRGFSIIKEIPGPMSFYMRPWDSDQYVPARASIFDNYGGITYKANDNQTEIDGLNYKISSDIDSENHTLYPFNLATDQEVGTFISGNIQYFIDYYSAKNPDMGGLPTQVLQRLEKLPQGKNYKYCIYWNGADSLPDCIIINPNFKNQEHDMSFMKLDITINKIDEKYLPTPTNVILTSPNGTKYSLSVDDSGVISSSPIV